MNDTFKHHEFNERQAEVSDSIRSAAEDLEAIIGLRCVSSRSKSIAMTKLEECVMWANKAIALHGVWEGEPDAE
jgi:hypothetical protein